MTLCLVGRVERSKTGRVIISENTSTLRPLLEKWLSDSSIDSYATLLIPGMVC